VGSCPRVFHVSFSCFSSVLDPKGRPRCLDGKVDKNLRTIRLVYWVNVSDSSGTSSSGLSRMKGRQTVLCELCIFTDIVTQCGRCRQLVGGMEYCGKTARWIDLLLAMGVKM